MSRNQIRGIGSFLALGCIVVLAGCGGGTGDATISGKVVSGGTPVTGGTLLFLPSGHAGKPAEAEVKGDGTYRSSGAMAGKHTVTFSPPAGEPPVNLQPGESAPPGPYDGLIPKQTEFDVKAGANTVEVELIKPAPPAG